MTERDNATIMLEHIHEALKGISESNNEILHRVTKMEVQQSGHASELHHLREHQKEVAHRVSALEVRVSVHEAGTSAVSVQLFRRWAFIGSMVLIFIAAVGNALSEAVIQAWGEDNETQKEEFYRDKPDKGSMSGDRPVGIIPDEWLRESERRGWA